MEFLAGDRYQEIRRSLTPEISEQQPQNIKIYSAPHFAITGANNYVIVLPC
jgi:hypothetical protein